MKNKIHHLRQEVMRVACANKKGHIAPSLSCLDILAVLRYDPWHEHDTVILSKAHGCYGLYAIDADQGRIKKDDWERFNLPGSYEGLGSLGHGLPIAAGVAFGRRLQGRPGHTYVIVGDGEMQEGSNWEALSFIAHHKLKNVTVIVDNNGLQAIEPVQEVMAGDLDKRFRGWGFIPWIIDGHDVEQIKEALQFAPEIIIAHTIKGKGFPAMEGDPKFHYRVPDEKERQPCK
jgi:transketolase